MRSFGASFFRASEAKWSKGYYKKREHPMQGIQALSPNQPTNGQGAFTHKTSITSAYIRSVFKLILLSFCYITKVIALLLASTLGQQ